MRPGSEESWERIGARAAELVAEALREGGLLVIVFGLLDYYLGEGHPDVEWPLRSSAVDVTLLFTGITMKVARQEWIHIRKR